MDLSAREQPQLLSIGIVMGGPTPSSQLIQEAVGSARKHAMATRNAYPNRGLRINVVFQVPGPMFKPDHAGVFASRFVRKTNHLLVNVAVPEQLTFDQVPDFFRQTLRAVKDEARDYLRKRKLHVEDGPVMALIDELSGDRQAA